MLPRAGNPPRLPLSSLRDEQRPKRGNPARENAPVPQCIPRLSLSRTLAAAVARRVRRVRIPGVRCAASGRRVPRPIGPSCQGLGNRRYAPRRTPKCLEPNACHWATDFPNKEWGKSRQIHVRVRSTFVRLRTSICSVGLRSDVPWRHGSTSLDRFPLFRIESGQFSVWSLFVQIFLDICVRADRCWNLSFFLGGLVSACLGVPVFGIFITLLRAGLTSRPYGFASSRA